MKRLALLLALLGLLAVAGCGGGDDADDEAAGPDLSAAAKDSLVVYSGRNENLVGPLLEMFTKESGIKVTPRYGDSAELAATLLEEGTRTPASVFFSQDAGALGALQDQGRLEPLPTTVLSLVPERYRSAQGAWVGVSGRSRVLAYNTDAFAEKDLPASVLDLTKPPYKGKVGYVPTNASFQAMVTAMRVTLGDARTKQFLTDFKANEPKVYDRNGQLAEAVDKGEVPLALLNHYYLYERGDEVGGFDKLHARNHYFKAGDAGALVNVAGVGVVKGKADARTDKLVRFLLSAPAQRYFADETHEYPLIQGVTPTARELPPLSQLHGPAIDLSQLHSLAETLAMLDAVGLT